MFLQDSKSVEELEMMTNGGAMMQQQQQPGQQKDYEKIFAGEKEYYELIKYEHKLDDVEDAFLLKFRKWLTRVNT